MKYETMSDRTRQVVIDSFGSLDRSVALCGGKGSFELRNLRCERDGSLTRRGGLVPLITLDGTVRGGTTILREGVQEHYVVAGSGVYHLSEEDGDMQATKIGELTTEEGEVNFACCGGAVLLLDGAQLWTLTSERMAPTEAYVPLYGKDWSPTDVATHAMHESPNLLSRRLRVRYVLGDATKSVTLSTLVPEKVDALLINGEPYGGSISYSSIARAVSIGQEMPAGAQVEVYMTMPAEFAALRSDVTACRRMAAIGQAEQPRMMFYDGTDGASIYLGRVIPQAECDHVRTVVADACMLYVREHDKITIGDGTHAVTGACRHYDRSLIFTACGTWMADGEENADGTLKLIPVNTTLGCSNAGAFLAVGNAPVSVYGHSVLRWNSRTDERDECNAMAISMPVETMLPSDFGRSATVCLDEENGDIWFYRPDRQGRIFVYQTVCEGWTSFDGFAPHVVFAFAGRIGIGIGQTLYVMSEEATADTLITEAHPEGVRVGIDAEYAGSFADFGLATQSKRLCAAEVVAACGDQTVQLMLQSVNGRRQRVPLQGDGNEISVMRRRTGMGRVRFVRLGVQADHDGPMRLYAIRLNARGGA
jgi:hypothetical protein